MEFDYPDDTICKPDLSDAFPLSPPTRPVHLPELPEISNRSADCKCFRIGYLTANLKIHVPIYRNKVTCRLRFSVRASYPSSPAVKSQFRRYDPAFNFLRRGSQTTKGTSVSYTDPCDR